MWKVNLIIQVRPDFIALHHPSNCGTAQALFKDGYAFPCQKCNRPTRMPFRWCGTGLCYDFRLHLARGFQACRIGIWISYGCNWRMEPMSIILFEYVNHRGN